MVHRIKRPRISASRNKGQQGTKQRRTPVTKLKKNTKRLKRPRTSSF